jgi:hypothetical protein
VGLVFLTLIVSARRPREARSVREKWLIGVAAALLLVLWLTAIVIDVDAQAFGATVFALGAVGLSIELVRAWRYAE